MNSLQEAGALLRRHIFARYTDLLGEAGGAFTYPCLLPGRTQYHDELWDWDALFHNVALQQVAAEMDNPVQIRAQLQPYERGTILTKLQWGQHDGWIPIDVTRDQDVATIKPDTIYIHNMHKPILAQHAAFIVRQEQGDAQWLRERFWVVQAFLDNYQHHHRHESGLFYWQDDERIGVDNDPAIFYRPPRSSGSIFLNCLMVNECEAMTFLCTTLHDTSGAETFRQAATQLKAAIQAHCWDERDGFFYSVDLNLVPLDPTQWLHSGQPRTWNTLIQRLGSWSGFLALWAGIATPEQARRIVEEHYRNAQTFHAAFGMRSLSRMEKMYNLSATGNPSNWLGPVWSIANYLVFRGLIRYGFLTDAQELAERTVYLLAQDIERSGVLHEYYDPETGEPIMGYDFQGWNYLVINMLAWLEGREVISE